MTWESNATMDEDEHEKRIQKMRDDDRWWRRLGMIISVPLIALICVQFYFLGEFTRLHGRLPDGGGELANWIFGWG